MTVAIVRGSITRKDSWLDFVSILERANSTLVNPRTTINICADKYRTALRLADYGLTQPMTKLINDPEKSNEQVEESDIKFPLIMKTLRGSKGVGVLFVDSPKGLDSIVQLIHKQDEDADLLIQEYIKTEYDVRVHVLGGKVLASMKDQLSKEILGQMYRKVQYQKY
jgi:gamma-F420-2:alpha-L-glutamate ligase